MAHVQGILYIPLGYIKDRSAFVDD